MSEEKVKEKPDVKEPLATFNQRFMAGLIDYLIVYGIVIIGVILNVTLSLVLTWLGYVLGFLFYGIGLAAAFFIFVWYPYKNDGQTIGKKRQKIKIMFIKDADKWTLRPVQEGDLVQLLIRAIIGGIEAAFIVPVVIAWYFITNDKNSQRLADQVAKTVVIQAEAEKATTTKTTKTTTKTTPKTTTKTASKTTKKE
ncbi:MAG: RDD family protein [Asgard group archaeon]|nr:RDD family protein [Asgard group archaeon]